MFNMIQFADAQTAANVREINSFLIEAGTDADYTISIVFEEGECEPKTVTTADGRVWTMTHVQNVNVAFAGRSHQKFEGMSGWVFRSQDGTCSDMFLNSNPFGVTPEWQAREWMLHNEETVAWPTNVTIW